MKIDLGVGETNVNISKAGFSLYMREADGPVLVEFHDHDKSVEQGEVLEAGTGLRGGDRFESITFSNLHTAAQTIEFYVGSREFIDNRDTGLVKITDAVRTESSGTAINALPDDTILGSAVKTIAANPLRKELHIYCDQPLKYGVGAGVSAGILIPKETIAILDIESSIELFNTTPTTANLSIVEVLK